MLGLARWGAFDGAGNLYYGKITFNPLQVELLKHPPTVPAESLGTVVDTTGGSFSLEPSI